MHGNANADNTVQNAARCLHAIGAPESIKVYPGASKPLLRSPRHDPEIHGPDGLGGVEGLGGYELAMDSRSEGVKKCGRGWTGFRRRGLGGRDPICT